MAGSVVGTVVGSVVGSIVELGGSGEMVGELGAGLVAGLGCNPWGGEFVAHPVIMVRTTTTPAELVINRGRGGTRPL